LSTDSSPGRDFLTDFSHLIASGLVSLRRRIIIFSIPVITDTRLLPMNSD